LQGAPCACRPGHRMLENNPGCESYCFSSLLVSDVFPAGLQCPNRVHLPTCYTLSVFDEADHKTLVVSFCLFSCSLNGQPFLERFPFGLPFQHRVDQSSLKFVPCCCVMHLQGAPCVCRPGHRMLENNPGWSGTVFCFSVILALHGGGDCGWLWLQCLHVRLARDHNPCR
jgi:hypothetical protein